MCKVVSLVFWRGGGGGGGLGAGNSVHSYGDLAQNRGICSGLPRLFMEQDTRLQAFIPLAKIPKALVFTTHLLLYTTCTANCGTRHAVTNVHAFGENAEHTGICSMFASLCTFLPLCTT